MAAILKLDQEYRFTRAALVNAGVDMAGSIDALYRDWRRWRDKSTSLAAVDREGVANADQWWSHHLAQFRCLIDPLHVAARAERARKDRGAARARPHPA
jgi:predicted pyridoxine 5'-phosphate oxidase superfamily flavin-nucleotide-binding protein